jgi:hypothetical protein
VADEHHRAFDRGEHVPHVGGVDGQAAQRVGDGHRAHVVLLQLRDDAVP